MLITFFGILMWSSNIDAQQSNNVNIDVNKNDGVKIDATAAYDPNATTSTPDIRLAPEKLIYPSPHPGPSPTINENEMISLPSPMYIGPGPGPFAASACVNHQGCNGKTCDDFISEPCSSLEKNFGCDCSGCKCFSFENDEFPTPSPVEVLIFVLYHFLE